MQAPVAAQPISHASSFFSRRVTHVTSRRAGDEGKMRELLDKGIVPVHHEMAEGRLKKDFFGGPPATKEGFWNDIRDKYKDSWDPVRNQTTTSLSVSLFTFFDLDVDLDRIKHNRVKYFAKTAG
jgi:hypothetical protein